MVYVPILLVDCSRSNGHAVVRLVGELDMSEAGRMQQVVLRAMRDSSGQLTLDLSELGFCDSSGVNAFSCIHKAAVRAGRDVVFKHPQANVRRVLELCGMNEIFTID